MEFIIKQRKSVLDLNFDEFIQEEFTEKQEKRIERQNIKHMEDELRDGMVLFRKYVMNEVVGSRKKLLSKGGKLTWGEFTNQSIYFINVDYSFDIDILKGATDYFIRELHNEDTELIWSSYSNYYNNKGNSKPVRKSKRSLDDFLIDTTT